MKRSRQSRRDAKQLYRICLVDGLLDDGRVLQVVQRVSESTNRNRFDVLAQFRRWVELDCIRHTAAVESAVPLLPDMRASLQAGLLREYGPGLNTSFIHIPALIGGVRIKVASDVYDGSVQARLAALDQSYSGD